MTDNQHASKLDMLRSFLEQDPTNLSLLSDCAEAALSEQRPEDAVEFLTRYAFLSPLTDREKNLAGLAALRQERFQEAAKLFEELTKAHPSSPPLQFNLGWSLAMQGAREEALAALDDTTVNVLGQAAALRVQIMHDQGRFEEAAEQARSLIKLHPDHAGLLAATSVLAMDLDDPELAQTTASRAGSHPDALVTLGLLSLDAHDIAGANAKFSEALLRNPASARGWIGRGLVAFSDGNLTEATSALQRGAELFGEHVGSWLATGWAQLMSGETAAAEASFHRARLLDPSFAEAQGSLAVAMFIAGRADEGRHLAEVARRLDSKSLTGSLAQALSLAGEGRHDTAKAIIERAMITPVSLNGRTLQDAVLQLARGR